ncbi:glycosyltransferase [Bacillus velezensis]|uniref:glycosyltransferase n=1 Tax=Bacillus velezensis TaxID=492670 RepID=UPI0006248454|nr:glycosyltransferase [Bacillus velezensis]AKF76296.1 UDP-glucose:polyglycerol phosphate glucosyltransferase [Bacillus velezensis]AKF76347.1 UDP-glucose:polyglycerol phosphate glucosyltransferase [Bacillus velezensis]MBL4961945.1 glycosyltransferase [Bacillus velezensis]
MSLVSPVFLFNSLNTKRGGMTKATIHRANTLVSEYKETQFLTILFQKNHRSIIQNLYNTNELDERVKVYNLFNDLDPSKNSKEDHRIKGNPNKEEEGFIVFKANNAFRYFKDGLYVKYKKFDNNGRLAYIDYMNEARHRLRREEYNEDGYLVRERQMDLFSNKPKLDRYFGKDGKCYLTTWLKPKDEEIFRCNLFYPEPLEFKNLEDLAAYWIANRTKEIESPIIMSDNPKNFSLLLDKRLSDVRKVVVLHTNHYDLNEKGEFELSQQYNALFKNPDKFDQIVFLTEEQKNDFSNEFGERLNYRVIPHGISKPDTEKDNSKVNPHLAVTLSRYHKEKGLEEAIKAFKKVVDVIPDAKYEIYGAGEHETYFQELIEKLNLTKNIELKGFTDNKIEVYQKAACSILTSKSEGFGLTILESLAAGTPVTSYDIKYGPKDMIQNEKNGYLVKTQNELADRVIKIMSEEKTRKRLSKSTKSIFKGFGQKVYQKAWFALLNE